MKIGDKVILKNEITPLLYNGNLAREESIVKAGEIGEIIRINEDQRITGFKVKFKQDSLWLRDVDFEEAQLKDYIREAIDENRR